MQRSSKWQVKYSGAVPCRQQYMMTAIRNSMRSFMLNQLLLSHICPIVYLSLKLLLERRNIVAAFGGVYIPLSLADSWHVVTAWLSLCLWHLRNTIILIGVICPSRSFRFISSADFSRHAAVFFRATAQPAATHEMMAIYSNLTVAVKTLYRSTIYRLFISSGKRWR